MARMRIRKGIATGAKIGAIFGFVSPFVLITIQGYLLPVFGWLVFLSDGLVAGLFFLFSPLPGLANFFLAAAANSIVYACFGAFVGDAVGRVRIFSRSRCQKCGYDLTGNVSGACPECGTELESPPSDERGPPVDRGAL